MNKRAQVTIFVILAILIVGGIATYFLLGSSKVRGMSVEMRPVYDYYLSCLKETASGGIRLMGEQGGYIETPDFVPGSQYMPFSSHLDFLGQGVPYWMYVSGNNILREQVPTIPEMEEELSTYLEERLEDCDFSEFSLQGYDVYVEGISSKASIEDFQVDYKIESKLTIFYQGESVEVTNHELSLESKLGKFYKLAREIFNFEKTDMFLEKYALDVMRLYAPVTGVEFSCSPKVFVEEEIKQGIVDGLSANIPSIKLSGDYYDLSSKERDYFVVDSRIALDENVNFLYSPDWPTKVEIHGDLINEPVGLQEGLGIMGFCYVPYHLIYDITFPVLVQFFDAEELFQFPVAVIISKNQPREALETTAGPSIESPVCEYKNQDMTINTYDLNLNPVDARIRFECLNSICEIGETRVDSVGSILETQIPQCVNGLILATAEGYADAEYRISSNTESSADILMNKKYKLKLDLGSVKRALINFNSEKYSTVAVYPEMQEIELIEEYYNITIYAYANTELTFPKVEDKRCVDIPESGLAGVFGAETEKCFEINLPPTVVSHAIVGGGKTKEYILESVLSSSSEMNINVPLFEVPKNLEELQLNQQAVEEEVVYLSFE